MAALMFSAACGQSNSALDPKYTSTFTPRNHFGKRFAITMSASGRLRRRRKLCVKNVTSDKKQEIEEPVTEGILNFFVPDSASVALSIKYHAEFTPSFSPEKFELSKAFFATAESVRDTLIINWNTTCAYYEKMNAKQAYYMSMEYLQGRALLNAIGNLQLTGPYAEALTTLRHNLEDVANQEPDAALGNGGLGRLASCFLDSMATLITLHGDMDLDTTMVYSNNTEQRMVRRKLLKVGLRWEMPGKL